MSAPTDPTDAVVEGERIYAQRFQSEFESRFGGQFAVVDIQSAQAVVAEFPEAALEKARTKFPGGVFHLIRIGSRSAFHMSFFAPRDAGLARLF